MKKFFLKVLILVIAMLGMAIYYHSVEWIIISLWGTGFAGMFLLFLIIGTKKEKKGPEERWRYYRDRTLFKQQFPLNPHDEESRAHPNY